tara:strand:+ start:1976 stop:2284 length:309 start_codon:yes stop_codon:yes gene_type:complete
MVVEIYNVVASFPEFEKYALGSQLRRAAVSVPSNITEGTGRNNPKEFNQFIGIALGSCYEIETQLEIAFRLDYLEKERNEIINDRIDKIKNMSYKLQRTITH